MKRLIGVLLAALVVVTIPGCGSERDKGINKGKDFPREGPTAPAK
jgi:hypothetical protein